MTKIIKLPTATHIDGSTRTRPGAARVRRKGVYVIFTSLEATLAATRAAHELATAMNAPLTIVHFRPVPYALPLTERTQIPNADAERLAEGFRKEGIDADIRVCLCRSEHDAAAMTLEPHSVVVVGGRHAWWPLTRAARWRRTLETAGHAVVAVDASQQRDRGNQANQLNLPRNYQITKSPNYQIPGEERSRA